MNDAMKHIINGLLFFIAILYTSKRFKFKQFKGPMPLPLIGNLYDPKSMSVITYINSCIRKYGPIFTFWAGYKPMLVICEPTLVRKILTNTSIFIKGPDYTEKFSVVFGKGLVTSNGKKHKEDRGCLGRFFTKSHIALHHQMICENTDKMIEEELMPNLDKIIDMQDFFHILSLRIFGEFSIGMDYSLPENHNAAKKLNTGVKEGSNIIGTHIILNIPMLFFLPSVQKVKTIVANVNNHINTIINERYTSIKKNKLTNEPVNDDILTTLILRNPENKLDESKKKDIQDHLRTTLAAGHDTTAFFGCYMAYLLSNHPIVQEKIRNEIRSQLHDTAVITEEDITKLTYCRCVLQEVLRLYTVIPFINRTSTKDYFIETTGQTIPANTTILIPLSIMNRNETIWENSNHFNPERFLNITGHNNAKLGYLPFGYGSRSCIGANLALTEGMIMMVKLVSRFKIHPIPNFKPSIIAGISLISKNGINVKLEEIEKIKKTE
tara:strand:+ start:690 stop:2171 length:1482 start_codon:yes stop_codon:yes gene_type:complete